jgi:tryptophan halogenase
MKKIVILGGGTAGWLTALHIKQIYNNASVTLIESSKVGILGAGEGSVPLLITFLESLNINLGEFKKECDATFKLGINFENWNGDNQNYLHPFLAPPGSPLDFKQLNRLGVNSKSGIPNSNSAYYIANALANNENLNEVIPTNRLIVEKKSPYYREENTIKISSGYSFHFNARKVADYLRKIGQSRGIKVIDGEYEDVLLDDKKNIKGIFVKDKGFFTSDFVFDCSGFQRLLIGGVYKTEWISYEKHLTVNSAIPFFLPQTEKVIRPETRAIAMKYGWMWQIPVKGRYGCGYIYDDNFINEEQAKTEVEEFLGHSVEVPKVFKFKAGRYKDVWQQNCIAVGLSAGFTEPLEATSVMTAIMQLLNLDPCSLALDNQKIRDIYNNVTGSLNDECVAFLYFHYMSQRNDTEFWSTYKDRTEIPGKLKDILDIWKIRSPKNEDLTVVGSIVFEIYSWYLVGAGVKALNLEVLKKENETQELDQKLKRFKQELLKQLYSIRENSIDNIQVGYGS